MPSFGFIEAGYTARGLVAACQSWMNLFIEKIDVPHGANDDTKGQRVGTHGFWAMNTPGKQLLVALPDQPNSCLVNSNAFFYAPGVNLFFALSGTTLYAIQATFAAGAWTGTYTAIATAIPNQTIAGTGGQLFPATIIVLNPTLLFVVSVGNAYVVGYGQAPSASTLGDPGVLYAVGDTGYAPINGIPATYVITGVDATTGAVTSYTLTGGTGYSVANYSTTTAGAQPGTGSGFTINVTSLAAAAWLSQQQNIPFGSTNYISSAAWQDGYVIVSVAPNDPDPLRRQFFISGLYAPTQWDPLDFDTKEGHPDAVVAVFSSNQVLGIFGSQTSEIWYDAGNVLSAFSRLPGGGVIQFGLAQPRAITEIAGTAAWLDSNARGQYICRMMIGSTPTRISNFALENHWSKFDTAGMSMSSYIEGGHEFLCVHFPIPDETWVYDHTVGPELGWHQRSYWDGAAFHADLGRYHAFFPEIGHAVADYRNGNIYLQSLEFLQDNCSNIRRIRVAPHITIEKRRNVYDRVKLHALTGRVPATGPGSDPVCMLSVSHDGGQNYGSPLTVRMGKIGETTAIIEWFHLGYGRDTVFKWECDEPIDICLVDMYCDFRPGYN
jgi:hypothetical protein